MNATVSKRVLRPRDQIRDYLTVARNAGDKFKAVVDLLEISLPKVPRKSKLTG